MVHDGGQLIPAGELVTQLGSSGGGSPATVTSMSCWSAGGQLIVYCFVAAS
jgi:hypothetical protein